MSLKILCGQCGHRFQVPEEYAGRRGKCGRCGTGIQIPYPVAEVEPAETPPTARPTAPLQANTSIGSEKPTATELAELVSQAGCPPSGHYAGQQAGAPSRDVSQGWFPLALVVLAGAAGLLVVVAVVVVVLNLADRPVERSRVTARSSARGFGDAAPVPAGSLPSISEALAFEPPDFGMPSMMGSPAPGIELRQVSYRSPTGRPDRLRLWVYFPSGSRPARSLPCVLIAPAGSNLLSGMRLGPGDQAEHLPYVRAGFAVVAYELAGPVGDLETASMDEMFHALGEFAAAGAGLVNAKCAMLYARSLPQVDPQQIYVAGHSSAGTAALLFAEHEPGVRGCIAFAPCSDVIGRIGGPALDEIDEVLPGGRQFLIDSSPLTHVDRLTCPVFLFHAQDDDNVPVGESRAILYALRERQRDATLRVALRGGHYHAMIDEGIPRAIDWLRGRVPGPAATVARPPVRPPSLPGPRIGGASGSSSPASGRVAAFKMLGYTGSGDPDTAARQAVAGIPWADPAHVYVDQENQEVVIGVRFMNLSTFEAKARLERAGFQLGGVSIRDAR